MTCRHESYIYTPNEWYATQDMKPFLYDKNWACFKRPKKGYRRSQTETKNIAAKKRMEHRIPNKDMREKMGIEGIKYFPDRYSLEMVYRGNFELKDIFDMYEKNSRIEEIRKKAQQEEEQRIYDTEMANYDDDDDDSNNLWKNYDDDDDFDDGHHKELGLAKCFHCEKQILR